MFGLRSFWRRRALRRGALSGETWQRAVAGVAAARGLSAQEGAGLREAATLFLSYKTITGADGLLPTEALRLSVAIQAALPILALDIDYYREWVEVIVYPGTFVAGHRYVDEAGVEHESRRPLSGESWLQGPVVLSEEDVYASAGRCDGFNVVIHEMAHKLDMLNGKANGFPPPHRGMSAAEWSACLSRAYGDLCLRLDEGAEIPLDAYAAEDPAEFFACASEAFFEVPERLREAYPCVYQQFRAFYRQDPARRRFCATL